MALENLQQLFNNVYDATNNLLKNRFVDSNGNNLDDGSGNLNVKQSGSIVAKWENNTDIIGEDDRYFATSVSGYDSSNDVLDISMYRQKYIYLRNNTDVSLDLGYVLFDTKDTNVRDGIRIKDKTQHTSVASGSKATIDITNEEDMKINCEGIAANIRNGHNASSGDIDLVIGGGY